MKQIIRKKFRIIISLIILVGFLSILELIVRSYIFQEEIPYFHIVERLFLLGWALYPIRRWTGKIVHQIIIMYAVILTISPLFSLYFSINNFSLTQAFLEYPLNIHNLLQVVILLLCFSLIYFFVSDYIRSEGFEYIEDSRVEFLSPSGKYKLVTWSSKTKRGWQGIMGCVYMSVNNKLLFDVRRNHGSFPYCFVEEHPNGHDYLVCGEDYQGQTILELDTRKRVDYIPEGEKNGVGFCWVDIHCSREKDVLAVEGCFWACPSEQWFVDFTEPMKVPLLVLGAFPSIEDNSNIKKGWSSKEGATILYSGYDQEEIKTVTWKRPEIYEVAQYWLEQVKNTKADSYFLADMQTQAETALKKLSAEEKVFLNSNK